MPTSPELLLARLDAIGGSLARSGHALALLALGSVGTATERLDAYSDLDFFAIAAPGHRAALLDDLSWLAAVSPIAFSYRNTRDGYKVLFADGIFGEFAIFEPAELATIPFAPGRVVWRAEGAPEGLAEPQLPLPSPAPARAGLIGAGAAAKDAEGLAAAREEWLLGEVLTNLYVGLGRDRRGEALAAMRLIQVHAVDRLLELVELRGATGGVDRDPFAIERRVERRLPKLVSELSSFAAGYGRSATSAAAILSFLDRHFAVDPAMRAAIRELLT